MADRRAKRRMRAGTSAASSSKVSPEVAAGAHTFVQFACVQCHGPQGTGGVDPAVPALSTVGQSLTVEQLTHIINHGLGESANPTQPYMPVWGELISKTQVATSSPAFAPACDPWRTPSPWLCRKARVPLSRALL
jgi:mono/diheme cytochrome c family protein